MLETAAALVIVKPLVGIVLSAIAGVAASNLYEKIWHRPREGVDELEVGLLKAAFHAVVDCYTQALDDEASSFSHEQRKAINARIPKFREIAKKAHKLPEEYVADLVALAKAGPPRRQGRQDRQTLGQPLLL